MQPGGAARHAAQQQTNTHRFVLTHTQLVWDVG